MKGAKNPERVPGQSYKDNTYANIGDIGLQRIKNAPRSKEVPGAGRTQRRVILILGVLLILAFITLVILTTFLFISYKSIGEEMSQMRKDSNVKQNLTNEVTASFSSDIQRISGSLGKVAEELQKVKNSNVKHNLTDQVTASFFSDIQRISGFLGKVAEELQKMKSSSNPLCSNGWKHYGLSCYYFSSDSKPWITSKKDCEGKEAHLVVIKGEGEMNFLCEIANKKLFWIGLTDADGIWRWVDGTPYAVTPKFWAENQPDDWTGHGFAGGEDCAALWNGNNWHDLHCSKKEKYICKKKMIF